LLLEKNDYLNKELKCKPMKSRKRAKHAIQKIHAK
jgi:hypothetical protein